MLLRIFTGVLLSLNLSVSFGSELYRYLITFADKDTTAFNPVEWFDPKALQRRERNHLPAFDFTDLPVKQDYVESLRPLVEEIRVVTRWLNGCVVMAEANKTALISALPWVSKVEYLPNIQAEPAGVAYNNELSAGQYEILQKQTASLGIETFRAQRLNGDGVRIAVFDVGFTGVDKAQPFEHLRPKIIATWDFVRNKPDVYGYGTHGTMVLSCIGGRHEGMPMGIATNAEFLLARTERLLSEKLSEEEYWLAAAEWADKNGADIINSSLGYTFSRYTYTDMDGKTSLVVRAAGMAASKGILVVNAAGNEGRGRWNFIGTPADGDSVLSVGGVDPDTYFRTGFSSYGPTSDGRLKPNVAAFGEVIAAGPKSYSHTYGTSFASPLIAGFAAALLQYDSTLTVMQLFRKIEQSGRLYPYFDYSHGYGIPHAAKALDLYEKGPPQLEFRQAKEGINIVVTPVRESAAIFNDPTDYQLYYHITDSSASVVSYKIISVRDEGTTLISVDDIPERGWLRASFRGHFIERKFELP